MNPLEPLAPHRVLLPGLGPAAVPEARALEEARARPGEWVTSEAARALEADLRRVVAGEVRFDAGSRALYATDGSNYRQVPIGVVVPRSEEDVVATIALCRRHGAPVLSRGGGTSLAGQCCNVAVVIDFSKHVNRLLELDPASGFAWVEPGLVLDRLRDAAEAHHLTFGPDPSTHDHCTLGGMIGNDSCGVHSVMAGRTAENVLALDVLTYDGARFVVGPTSDDAYQELSDLGGRRAEIHARLRMLRDRTADLVRARYPRIERRVSGYNLDALLPENGFDVARALVGSEGTCVTVLRAKVRLVHSPPSRALLVLGYPSVYEAGDHVPELRRFGPIGLEGIDDRLVEDMKKKRLHPERLKLLPDGKGWLLVEFGGDTRAEAEEKAHRCMDALRKARGAPSMKLFDDRAEEAIVWKVRESGLGATARVPGEKDTWEGWEDSAVPIDRVGPYLRDLRRLFEESGYDCALYGHFGQGCIHTRIDFDLTTRDGIARYRRFVERAADLVLSHGGSLSGEHGDGQSRAELLPKMFGPVLVDAFREFKAIWDPAGKMNPGKVVDPYPLDSNLRLGEGYRELAPRTAFAFDADARRFGRATARCVGVGECRRDHGGVMCPSYRVTREEMHSTRGRAHLLFEAMEGEPLRGGWREPAVKEALDLCLACKGCKSDCPMNVDMASYKAEFLSHYYQGRLRPRAAYAMGLVMYWARLASFAPWLANLVAAAPGLSALAKWAGGIALRRRVPRFAPYTFREWFRARPPGRGGTPVVLFPDTFNDHFHPETAIAAVEVLEAAGAEVRVPDRWLCCGRPLYDYGLLDRAKGLLGDLVDALSPAAEAGIPIVGLEPSCVAVFRDELVDMLPDDPRARRLSEQVLTLSEWLDRRGDAWTPPRLRGPAVMQGHCHHHAVMGLAPEERVAKAAGLDVTLLDGGCCGMAGSFGFEAGERYRVSVAAGELAVLPAVRKAPPEALVLADGFSCREQIAQGTRRRAVHLAEALAAGLRGGWRAGAPWPERTARGRRPGLPARAWLRKLAPQLALGLALAWVAGALGRRRRGR
ncbi:FAD-binding and (Fe-S)-binding domain-containing protein [Anaeromyxobacter paludicola]|uniref:Dimethylmenaquinone methyltransferase n=1 Tax=Anaeromyxobacter paludicola TaxID=2918171 RepID=A0ABN6NDE1_9BACT|nr:FAD-binding and (Fe-S)-binding domain-containing protein [Anaeromyxobacter paludicola]BDG10531.1 dimethylmenaquinone methyltransferase [Anaeromyxobacter paludicola]